MSFCDFERPEFASSTWRKAIKDHYCCECGKPILKGERYAVTSGKWDGDVTTYKQHLECEEACRFWRDIANGGQNDCLCFGELWEGDVFNQYDIPPKGDPIDNRFRTVYAKAKWRKEKGRELWLTKGKPPCNKSLIKDRDKRRV